MAGNHTGGLCIVSAGVLRLVSAIQASGKAAATETNTIAVRMSQSAKFGGRANGLRGASGRRRSRGILPAPPRHGEQRDDRHDQREHQRDRHRRSEPALRTFDADAADVIGQTLVAPTGPPWVISATGSNT